MGWGGFVVDVAVGGVTTLGLAAMKGTPIGWGVSIVGGAVGGVAGQWWDDGGPTLEGTFKGAFSGAVGGLLGFGAGKAVGKVIGKWSDNAAKKVNDAGNPDVIKSATEGVDQAKAAKKALQDELSDVDYRLRQPGLKGKEKNNLLAEKRRLEAELRPGGPADRAIADANAELRKVKRDNPGIKDAVDKAKANQKKADWWKENLRYPQATLVGLGSALARGGTNIYNSSGGDGGSGPPNGNAETPPGEETVELMWSGLAAANSAGLFGKPPFVADPSIQAQGSGFLAHPVKLNRAIATWYGGPANSFATSLAENYKMFGDLEKKEDLKEPTPIRTLAVPAGVSSGSAGGQGYSHAVQALNGSATALNKAQSDLATTLKDVEEITRTGQENIANLISGVNAVMPSIPAGDIDASFLTLLSQAISEAAGIMNDGAASAELAARTIGNPNLNANPSGTDLANAIGRIGSGLDNPALWPDSNAVPTPTDIDKLMPKDIDADLGKNPALDNAIDRLERASAPIEATPAGLNPAAAVPAANPGANMMGSLMSSMLPMMMQQMMMRNMADNDLAGRRADLDPSRYDRERAATAPAPVAPPVGTTPWSAQQAAATPSAAAQPQTQAQPHTQTGPSSGATSSQTGGRPPRTPGEDGSVVYSFPDGRTQKVSPTVAKVLDKAFANIKGTDAQEAYAETEAKWTDRKEIGTRVDPFQLMTGDVATWDDRTAVLVVFGSAEEGTLEVIVNGEIEPFAPEMSDSTGEFGQFTGFVHPPGIEVGGSKDTSSDGAAPATGDQQASPQSGDPAVAAVPV